MDDIGGRHDNGGCRVADLLDEFTLCAVYQRDDSGLIHSNFWVQSRTGGDRKFQVFSSNVSGSRFRDSGT